MAQRETQRKPEREQNFIIVDFNDIDTKNLSFGAPKQNKHGGLAIPIRYCGKNLYVRYPRMVTPFGVSENTDKDKKTGKEKITGHSLSLSFGKEYTSDPHFAKAQEIDEFFIDACVKNSVAWNLGGSATKPIARDSIEGYDDHGANGKWKRLIKWSYKKNASTNEREYLQYPPRLEVSMPAAISGEFKEDQTSKFTVPMFDESGAKITYDVTGENINSVIPKWSEASTLTRWSNLTQGTYGCTMKPSAEQLRVYPRVDLPVDACLLGDDDLGEAAMSFEDMDVTSVPAFSQPMKAPVPTAAEEDDDAGVDYVEEEETPAPVAPAKTRRVVAKKVV